MIPSELPTNAIGSTYRERLHPWCIVCLLPNLQSSIVSRHRHRSQAEEHLKVLRRLSHPFTYTIVFDPISD